MNFRELVDQVRGQGRSVYERPRPIRWVAERCGISVATLYFLFNGEKTAQPWTVSKIARGLRKPVKIVQQALVQSRVEGIQR